MEDHLDDVLTETQKIKRATSRREVAMAAAYEHGASLYDIARHADVVPETVRKALMRRGVAIRRQGAHVPTSAPRITGRPQA